MNTRRTALPLGLLAGFPVALPARAHPGHGEGLLHAHASDVFGLVIVLALAVVALWLGRR